MLTATPTITTAGVSLGILIPFAAIFAAAARVWVTRHIRTLILYATPKHLERRINLAAEFVDGRRAYRLGGRNVWVALVIGRQWTHHNQAAAVLLDEFMPRTDQPADTPR